MVSKNLTAHIMLIMIFGSETRKVGVHHHKEEEKNIVGLGSICYKYMS